MHLNSWSGHFQVLSALLSDFASTPTKVPLSERRQFTVVCQVLRNLLLKMCWCFLGIVLIQDAVSTYLGELYMRQTQETTAMVSTFRFTSSQTISKPSLKYVLQGHSSKVGANLQLERRNVKLNVQMCFKCAEESCHVVIKQSWRFWLVCSFEPV